MKAVKAFVKNHLPGSSKSTSENNNTTSSNPAAPAPTATTANMPGINIKTILILGGTSGIGEIFAKRFHAQGKKVIVTGRREQRLKQLEAAGPGIESFVMDNLDFANIPKNLDALFAKYPDIDSVWVNGGIQNLTSVKDINSSSDADVIKEISTNLTAPLIIARHVLPKLLARGAESTFIITSSGLGFVSSPAFPVYNATKAGIHQYLVSARQALKDSNVNIVEIVPPYVATELDTAYKANLPAHVKPQPLEEFTDQIFAQLDTKSGKELLEVAGGTATPRVEAWRNGPGAILAPPDH